MTNSEDTVRPLPEGEQYFFAKLSFREKQKLMREATDWLSSQGIRYYQTRIGKYLKDLEGLIQAHENDTVQKLIDDGEFPSLVNSLFESSDVISIYQGLHPIAVGPLGKRLREFVRGAEFASSESGDSISNRGRDIGFELYMASLFSRAGYELDFGTQADIMASNSKCTLIIECKRPRFDHSVRSNSRAAAKQLTERLKAYDPRQNVFGIICLSIERVMNPNNQLANASDERNMDRFLKAEWQAFARKHERGWRYSDDPRLLGVTTLLRVPGILENPKMLATCRFLGAISLQAAGQSGHELLTSVNLKLAPHLTEI